MTIENLMVSCIMVTANRPEFVASSIDDFLKQDYANAELVIIDDGLTSCADIIPANARIHYHYFKEPLGTIGRKRNFACQTTKGDLIIHWDDDDWYAPYWISRHVETFMNTNADITGLRMVRYFSEALQSSFVYESIDEDQPWVCGATMAYRKTIWENYPFVNQPIGEDTDFIKNSGGKIAVLNYLEGFTARIHEKNISIRQIKAIVPKFENGKLIG